MKRRDLSSWRWWADRVGQSVWKTSSRHSVASKTRGTQKQMVFECRNSKNYTFVVSRHRLIWNVVIDLQISSCRSVKYWLSLAKNCMWASVNQFACCRNSINWSTTAYWTLIYSASEISYWIISTSKFSDWFLLGLLVHTRNLCPTGAVQTYRKTMVD